MTLVRRGIDGAIAKLVLSKRLSQRHHDGHDATAKVFAYGGLIHNSAAIAKASLVMARQPLRLYDDNKI